MAKGKSRVRTVSYGVRVPVGVSQSMEQVMLEERLWARPTNYIIEAIHEKNQRHLAAARERLRERTAEGVVAGT